MHSAPHMYESLEQRVVEILRNPRALGDSRSNGALRLAVTQLSPQRANDQNANRRSKRPGLVERGENGQLDGRAVLVPQTVVVRADHD